MKLHTNTNKQIKQIASALIACVCMSVLNISYANDTSGVLVASETSTLQKTKILEIRRIYLGLPSSSNSLISKPVINLSDKETYKAFLKNVLHMTENGYRRKLVKRIFSQGRKKVAELKSTDEIVIHLNKNIQDVSFMNEETARKTKGIKVIQVLW